MPASASPQCRADAHSTPRALVHPSCPLEPVSNSRAGASVHRARSTLTNASWFHRPVAPYAHIDSPTGTRSLQPLRTGDTSMSTLLARASIAVGIGIVATVHATGAHAACGAGDWSGPAASWPQVTATAIASLRSAAGTSQEKSNVGIVGLWSVTFTAEDNPGGPPDGTVIDAGYATWHADRTEIMNSGRPPITGNFCMGVWKFLAPDTYKLN